MSASNEIVPGVHRIDREVGGRPRDLLEFLGERNVVVRGMPVRITGIDTIRTEEFPNLVHVLLHTSEGVTGLGETFFFADAVEAHIHTTVADYLLGEDPADIERHCTSLRGYVGTASSGAETRAASAVDIALWDLRGKALGQPLYDLLGGRSRDRIRTYNTCAGSRLCAWPPGPESHELGSVRGPPRPVRGPRRVPAPP